MYVNLIDCFNIMLNYISISPTSIIYFNCPLNGKLDFFSQYKYIVGTVSFFKKL